MKIEILGSDSERLKKTEKIVRKTIKKLKINSEIKKIEDFDEIVKRGVIITPAVLVDGEVKIFGKIPTADDVIKILK